MKFSVGVTLAGLGLDSRHSRCNAAAELHRSRSLRSGSPGQRPDAGAASCYRYAKIVGLHSQRFRRRSFWSPTKKLKWRLVREAAELPNLKLVVITDDDFADDPDADIPMLSLETWLAKTPDAPLPPGPRSTDLAALVYTSGTTG